MLSDVNRCHILIDSTFSNTNIVEVDISPLLNSLVDTIYTYADFRRKTIREESVGSDVYRDAASVVEDSISSILDIWFIFFSLVSLPSALYTETY